MQLGAVSTSTSIRTKRYGICMGGPCEGSTRSRCPTPDCTQRRQRKYPTSTQYRKVGYRHYHRLLEPMDCLGTAKFYEFNLLFLTYLSVFNCYTYLFLLLLRNSTCKGFGMTRFRIMDIACLGCLWDGKGKYGVVCLVSRLQCFSSCCCSFRSLSNANQHQERVQLLDPNRLQQAVMEGTPEEAQRRMYPWPGGADHSVSMETISQLERTVEWTFDCDGRPCIFIYSHIE